MLLVLCLLARKVESSLFFFTPFPIQGEVSRGRRNGLLEKLLLRRYCLKLDLAEAQYRPIREFLKPGTALYHDCGREYGTLYLCQSPQIVYHNK